jgi:hypothetical protein
MDAGLSQEAMLEIRGDWRIGQALTHLDRLVLEVTDDVLADGAASRDSLEACLTHLGRREIVDLLFAITTWLGGSVFLRSLEVPLPEGMEPWPPDGRAPLPRPSADGAARGRLRPRHAERAARQPPGRPRTC